MDDHLARELIGSIEALKESVDSLVCAIEGDDLDFEPDFHVDDREIN